eukprot:COSAG01_NODE_8553_length_2744_cov_4.364461_1_plen_524_part_10
MLTRLYVCRHSLRHNLGHMLFDSSRANLSISTEQIDGSIIDVLSVSHHCVPHAESCAHPVVAIMKSPSTRMIHYRGHNYHIPPTVSASDAEAYAKDSFLAEHASGAAQRVGATYQAEGTHAFHEHFFQHAEPLSNLYHALYGEHGIVGRDNSNALRLYLLALDLIKEHGVWQHRRRKLQSNVPIGDQNSNYPLAYQISQVDPVCNRWGANGFTPTFALSTSSTYLNRPYFSSSFDYCYKTIGGSDWPAHSSGAATWHLTKHVSPFQSGPAPDCGYKCTTSNSGTCSSRPHCASTWVSHRWWLTGMCGPAVWDDGGHAPGKTSSRGAECWPGVCGDCCNWKGCWDHDCGIITDENMPSWISGGALDEFCQFGRKYCVKGYRREGSWSSAQKCVKCPTGQYQEHQPFKGTTCTSCPNGQTSSAGASSCTTLYCGSGRYKWGSSCYYCQSGRYQSSSRHTYSSCSSCSAGQYQSSTGATSCSGCPSGQASSAGAPSCTTVYCGSGAFKSGSSCYYCQSGRYQSSSRH